MSQVHAAKVMKKHIKLDDVVNQNWSVLDQSYDIALAPLVGDGRKYRSETDMIEAIHMLPSFAKLPEHIRQFLSIPDRMTRIAYTRQILIEAV